MSDPALNHAPSDSHRMRPFYTIWLGQLISLTGSELTGFAIAVWLVAQTGQATPFALTLLFSRLPAILLAPFAGAVVDREDRRLVMILADSASALSTLGIGLLVFSGNLAVWHLYTYAAINSIFSAFQEPAYMASITMLVPKSQFGRASGLIQMAQAFGRLVSPFIAGLLFVAIGLPGIVLVDFASFLFAVGALLLVRIPQPERVPAEDSGKGRFFREASFGWKYIASRPGLLGMLAYFSGVNFFTNLAAALIPPMILANHSAAILGVSQGLAGGGMLAGSLLMSAWGGAAHKMRAVYAFIAAMGLGFILSGLHPSPWIIAAGFTLILFAVPLASAHAHALWQAKVEPGVQGRVFATRSMLATAMMPLAFLLAGPLADRLFEPLMAGGRLASLIGPLIGAGPGRGIALIFLISGAMVLLATGLAILYTPLRRVEAELPDALPEQHPAGPSGVVVTPEEPAQAT